MRRSLSVGSLSLPTRELERASWALGFVIRERCEVATWRFLRRWSAASCAALTKPRTILGGCDTYHMLNRD